MAVSSFGKNIKALREQKGYTQPQLAQAIDVSTTTVSGWETRGVIPRKPTLEMLKEKFALTDDDLLSASSGLYARQNGIAQVIPQPSDTYAPIAGFAPCGEPHEMIWELTDERHWVPPHVVERWPDGFFVHVHGDSMDRVIPDGAFAFVAPGAPCNNHIGLVKVNGDEATVKRVRITSGVIILEPESSNPEHKRRVIDETDPDSPAVRVIGRVVWMDANL